MPGRTWPNESTRFTGGRGVDVVIEHIGQAVWDQCLRSLAARGAVGHLRRDVRTGESPGCAIRLFPAIDDQGAHTWEPVPNSWKPAGSSRQGTSGRSWIRSSRVRGPPGTGTDARGADVRKNHPRPLSHRTPTRKACPVPPIPFCHSRRSLAGIQSPVTLSQGEGRERHWILD